MPLCKQTLLKLFDNAIFLDNDESTLLDEIENGEYVYKSLFVSENHFVKQKTNLLHLSGCKYS